MLQGDLMNMHASRSFQVIVTRTNTMIAYLNLLSSIPPRGVDPQLQSGGWTGRLSCSWKVRSDAVAYFFIDYLIQCAVNMRAHTHTHQTRSNPYLLCSLDNMSILLKHTFKISRLLFFFNSNHTRVIHSFIQQGEIACRGRGRRGEGRVGGASKPYRSNWLGMASFKNSPWRRVARRAAFMVSSPKHAHCFCKRCYSQLILNVSYWDSAET